MRAEGLGVGVGRAAYLAACVGIFAFLLVPLVVMVPLSFNVEPYFTFTEGMLRLDAEAFSLRWYRQVASDPVWRRALANSLFIGTAATLPGDRPGHAGRPRAREPRHAGAPSRDGAPLSPMVTPLVISATGMFFFYSALGLAQTHLGLILAHAALGTPFVVITVTATLASFDRNLTRAANGLGAGPWRTFRRVELPLIAPGVVSGALFAFAVSFDEVVVVLFMAGEAQRTIPRQMWAGVREQISSCDPGRGDLPDRLCRAALVRGGVAPPPRRGQGDRLAGRAVAPSLAGDSWGLASADARSSRARDSRPATFSHAA